MSKALCWICLLCRVGDTYPHNMLEVHMRAYFYKWHPRTTLEGDILPFEVSLLIQTHPAGKQNLGVNKAFKSFICPFAIEVEKMQLFSDTTSHAHMCREHVLVKCCDISSSCRIPHWHSRA